MLHPSIEIGPVKKALISLAATGDVVAAVTGKKIRVVEFCIVAAGAVTANFESGTTDITGVMSLITGVPVFGNTPFGCFETAAGAALRLTLGGSVQVSGWVNYQEL